MMKITYDKIADAAYIYLTEIESLYSIFCEISVEATDKSESSRSDGIQLTFHVENPKN